MRDKGKREEELQMKKTLQMSLEDYYDNNPLGLTKEVADLVASVFISRVEFSPNPIFELVPAVKNDQNFMLAALKIEPQLMSQLHDSSLLENSEFMLALANELDHCSTVFYSHLIKLDPNIRTNDSFMTGLLALRKKKFLSAQATYIEESTTRTRRSDRHIASMFNTLTQNDYEYFSILSDHLRENLNDKALVLTFLDPRGLGHSPNTIRETKIRLIKIIDGRNISEDLRVFTKKELERIFEQEQCIAWNQAVLAKIKQHYPNSTLRSDRSFVLDMITQGVATIDFASDALRGDKEFMKAMITQGVAKLNDVRDERLKDDTEIVSLAIKKHGASEFNNAGQDCRNSRELLLQAINGIKDESIYQKRDLLCSIGDTLLNELKWTFLNQFESPGKKSDNPVCWQDSFSSLTDDQANTIIMNLSTELSAKGDESSTGDRPVSIVRNLVEFTVRRDRPNIPELDENYFSLTKP